MREQHFLVVVRNAKRLIPYRCSPFVCTSPVSCSESGDCHGSERFRSVRLTVLRFPGWPRAKAGRNKPNTVLGCPEKGQPRTAERCTRWLLNVSGPGRHQPVGSTVVRASVLPCARGVRALYASAVRNTAARHMAPLRLSTTRTVRSKILQSSSSDQFSIYSRSS